MVDCGHQGYAVKGLCPGCTNRKLEKELQETLKYKEDYNSLRFAISGCIGNGRLDNVVRLRLMMDEFDLKSGREPYVWPPHVLEAKEANHDPKVLKLMIEMLEGKEPLPKKRTLKDIGILPPQEQSDRPLQIRTTFFRHKIHASFDYWHPVHKRYEVRQKSVAVDNTLSEEANHVAAANVAIERFKLSTPETIGLMSIKNGPQDWRHTLAPRK
jgi:hypothetical protein